jgi:hypothetical protein
MAAGEKNPANDGLRWSRLALLGPMEQNSHIEGLAVGWWLRSRELDWVWRGVCDGRWSMVNVKCEWWWLVVVGGRYLYWYVWRQRVSVPQWLLCHSIVFYCEHL